MEDKNSLKFRGFFKKKIYKFDDVFYERSLWYWAKLLFYFCPIFATFGRDWQKRINEFDNVFIVENASQIFFISIKSFAVSNQSFIQGR